MWKSFAEQIVYNWSLYDENVTERLLRGYIMVLNHVVALDMLYEWPGMMNWNEIWCSCCSQSELRKATMNLSYGTQFHDGTVGKIMYVTTCILITYMVFDMEKFGTMPILHLLCVFFDATNVFTGLKAISIRDYSALIFVYFEME